MGHVHATKTGGATSGTLYEENDDIGEIMDGSDDLDSNDTSIEEVKVLSVYQLERMYLYINCRRNH